MMTVMMMMVMMRMKMIVYYACDIVGHVGGACTAVQVPRTGGRGTSATCPPVVDAVGVVIFQV